MVFCDRPWEESLALSRNNDSAMTSMTVQFVAQKVAICLIALLLDCSDELVVLPGSAGNP